MTMRTVAVVEEIGIDKHSSCHSSWMDHSNHSYHAYWDDDADGEVADVAAGEDAVGVVAAAVDVTVAVVA